MPKVTGISFGNKSFESKAYILFTTLESLLGKKKKPTGADPDFMGLVVYIFLVDIFKKRNTKVQYITKSFCGIVRTK